MISVTEKNIFEKKKTTIGVIRNPQNTFDQEGLEGGLGPKLKLRYNSNIMGGGVFRTLYAIEYHKFTNLTHFRLVSGQKGNICELEEKHGGKHTVNSKIRESYITCGNTNTQPTSTNIIGPLL